MTQASFFKALLECKVHKDEKCLKLFNVESAFGDIVHIVQRVSYDENLAGVLFNHKWTVKNWHAWEERLNFEVLKFFYGV